MQPVMPQALIKFMFATLFLVHRITDAFKHYQEGKMTIGGDDYYAELDYIEVMETAKEGYEEEAITPDEDSVAFQPGLRDFGKLADIRSLRKSVADSVHLKNR